MKHILENDANKHILCICVTKIEQLIKSVNNEKSQDATTILLLAHRE
jgi:hypothetical protein